jgi:diacylglycerol kinase family enzyme
MQFLELCYQCQAFKACQMVNSIQWGVKQNQLDLLEAIERNSNYSIYLTYPAQLEKLRGAIKQLKPSRSGEAGERTKLAIEAGVDAIVVYGGDGTILEVASNMAGSNIPLVILPGGTANVLSIELGILWDQNQAALLLGGVPNMIRVLDMGVLVGGKRDKDSQDDLFFFHLGMGLEGEMH